MDHINSDGPPTARTQKISTNAVQFPYLSTKFPFTHTHTHTHCLSKVVEAKCERMKDKSN